MLSNNHWKTHYQPITDILSGSYKAYDIYNLSKPYACTGRKDYIDGVLLDGKDLTDIPTANLYTGKDYNAEAAAGKTFANWSKQFTPFMDVDRSRIAVTPKLIEAGSSFKHNEEDLMMAGANPESDVARNIIASFRRKKAIMFINALNAASVRESKVVKNGGTGEYEDIENAKAFPTAQKYTTKQAGYIAIEDLTALSTKTADNMTDDEQWYLLISPTQKELMINNNIDHLFSKDFVTSGSLEDARLPRFMNFIMIAHPLMNLPAFNKKFFAFTKDAIAQANFTGIDFNVGESTDRRFEKVIYYSQNLDFQRKDDGKVIQGTVA